VLRLRILEGRSTSEVAALIQRRQPAVRQLQVRALAALRAAFAAYVRPLPCGYHPGGYSQSLRLKMIQSTRAVTGIRTAAAIRPEALLKPGYGTFMP
jgi:hypothetical protein